MTDGCVIEGYSESFSLHEGFLRVGSFGLQKEKAEIVCLNCKLEVDTFSSDILAEDN